MTAREFFTVHEAASVLKVSPARILAMVETGVLEAFAVGPRAVGISRADVLALSWPPLDGAA